MFHRPSSIVHEKFQLPPVMFFYQDGAGLQRQGDLSLDSVLQPDVDGCAGSFRCRAMQSQAMGA